MSNENESLPNINPIVRKASYSSSIMNASSFNNNNNNVNVTSDCDSIISYKDEKSPEKKAFFEKVYKTKHGDSRSILSIAKDLSSNIQSLDGKISSILGKHHKDYVATFNEFMMAVKKDLREKIDSLEQIDTEKKKSDDVENLKTERNFFREEAIRLNNLCKELNIANEDLIRDANYKATEIKHLMKKWKESEAANRQLLVELEKNLKLVRILEKDKKFVNLNSKQAADFNNNDNIYNNYKTGNSKSLYKTVFNSVEFNNNNLNDYRNNYNENDIYNKKHAELKSSAEKQNEYKPNLNNLYKSSSSSNIINKKEIYNNIKNNNKNDNKNNTNFYSSTNSKINLNNSSSFIMHNNSTDDADLLANSNLNNSSSNNNNNYNQNFNILNFENNNINSINNFSINNKQEKERIVRLIEKLKAELKREKNRNQKLLADFNVFLLEKKKLEKIFMDCVEESRKEILQRKLRDTIHSTKSGFFGSFGASRKTTTFTQQNSLPTISEVKFENFQLSDKRRLVEAFLMKDEVVNFIRENLSSINPNVNANNNCSFNFNNNNNNNNVVVEENDNNNNNINNVNSDNGQLNGNCYVNGFAGNFNSNSNNNKINNNNNYGFGVGSGNKKGGDGGVFYAKNAMNESAFTFRQTMLKSEVAKFGFDDLTKSKNSFKSSSKNFNFLK